MFPLLIVLIFSLFQSLNAAGGEFPRLSEKISVKWDSVLIPAEKVDFRLTASFDGVVPNIIFCGPFKAGGNDGTCEWTTTSSFRGDQGYHMGSGKGDAKNILTINDDMSCMRVTNPFQGLSRLYQDATESNGQLSISYTCKTSSGIIAVIIPVLLLICAIAGVAFYVGKKNGIQKNAQENAYGAYAGKHPNNMPANPSLGSPLC